MWNNMVTLVKDLDPWQDDSGAWHKGETVEREVFCKVGMLGTLTMSQLRSSEIRIVGNDSPPEVGLRDMHVLYIKQIDYDNESRVIFNGEEMDIIGLTSERECYKMIIRKRIGNGSAEN